MLGATARPCNDGREASTAASISGGLSPRGSRANSTIRIAFQADRAAAGERARAGLTLHVGDPNMTAAPPLPAPPPRRFRRAAT
jgi:hypothetical protein